MSLETPVLRNTCAPQQLEIEDKSGAMIAPRAMVGFNAVDSVLVQHGGFDALQVELPVQRGQGQHPDDTQHAPG